MNKNDIKLITIIIVISVISLLIYLLFNNESDKALVYYENKLLLEIDLNLDDIYIVKGYNGDIKIEVKNKKIRVVEENSNYHLCSKQGYIDRSGEMIVCLPNKVIITINNSDYDVMVG